MPSHGRRSIISELINVDSNIFDSIQNTSYSEFDYQPIYQFFPDKKIKNISHTFR